MVRTPGNIPSTADVSIQPKRGWLTWLGCAGASLMLLVAITTARATTQFNVTTYHYDNLRTGQDISETILTAANVNTSRFGKLYSTKVDGYVYSQPLYVSNVSIAGKGTLNVVYVATEHDSVYAINADSGEILWQRSFLNPPQGITSVPSTLIGCSDIVPEVGITSTPVIDVSSNTIYVVAKTDDSGTVNQRIHALDIATGMERGKSPALIQASVHGTGDGSVNGVIHFDAFHEAQRASLLLQNGMIFIAWASLCDTSPYHAWVMAYNVHSLQQMAVWNSTPNGGLGGIWQSGAGLAGDSEFNTFFATSNGTFDGNHGGIDYGNTIARLSLPSGNMFRVADSFTPYNQEDLSEYDMDLGSGGVLLLPDQLSGATYKHILVESGKEGSIYVINRDHMGGYNPNDNSQIVQFLPYAIGGMWAVPAWWNNSVYFGGSGDALKQFSFTPSTGTLSLSPVTEASYGFGYPGTIPIISANGNSNAILWAIQTDSYYNLGPAVLHAFDAINLGNELYNSSQNSARDTAGSAVKFSVPVVANGKVYVGTAGQLDAYGLLPETIVAQPLSSQKPQTTQ
jgi:hypothetical protein